MTTYESVRRQVEDIAWSVRRMRERFEDAAVVEAARIRHAAEAPLTAAEERVLLFRVMMLGTRSWPGAVLAEIEHDLLAVSRVDDSSAPNAQCAHDPQT